MAETKPGGTRPRNRRELIIAAASRLFYEQGYARVGVSDIAEAVGVGPSALYRHFKGKQLLLHRVVLDHLHPFERVLGARSDDLDAVVRELAATALDHRELGVLWQREARHLPAEDRDELKDQLRVVAGGLADLARSWRPDLAEEDARFRGWCLFSALTSPSYHRVELPRAQFEALLRDVIVTVAGLPPLLSGRGAAIPDADALLLQRGGSSRRRQLLSAATRLFAERGYAAVTTEEIGAEVGIAGPSVYNHFASKQELLDAVITRGSAWLEIDLGRTLVRRPDAAEALRALLWSYITFALDHGGFIDILVGEVGHLPDHERHRARQTQHEYVTEWVALLREVRPELDAATARVLVQATLTLANDMARTGTVRAPEAVRRVGAALMFTSGSEPH
ncbi:TetR/AcrR family transcriptional regulator [Saccharopolyspora gregorii]|uniref:TetR/AcrR family transcriptional regulator n=1 Tax=Saccharopolyspora gregorii TaxID=33914 RepID=UPI0021AC488B|nr:TetR/AcrR family transcriptional regulator [Saccharopolyspora gregorii]